MNIYIDVGNTNIKITFEDNTLIFKTHNQKIIKEIKNQLSFKRPISNIYGTCVVPQMKKILEKYFMKISGKSISWINRDYKLNVDISINDNLGSDLIAISAYASENYKNVIIVNLGTATTFSHIKNNKLMGVNISPGIELQYNSLINNASLLKKNKLQYINKSIGTNTNESISIGIINSAIETIKAMCLKIDKKAEVVISGGNAVYIFDHIEYKYIPEVTTLGIKKIFLLNEKQKIII